MSKITYFEGTDSSDNVGLWVSDGEGPGTVELSPISGANVSGIFTNVTDPDFTEFNGNVLFEGYDSANHYGLWVTNGTASGTFELTISGSNANGIFNGIEGPDFTIFNDVMLFEGVDTAGRTGLWESTSGSIFELTGISGANIAFGLDPSDLTVFNGAVYFSGLDTAGSLGLWTTNGTAAGTSELTPITGAGGNGVHPVDLTYLNGELLFQGVDTAIHEGLWVSNGTAAGTHELSISGANTNGLFVFNFTGTPGFVVYGNEALFLGTDTAGNQGLWATDGTALGTHEITGIAGANPTGLLPSDFFVYNGEVLFAGEDSSGNYGLWATNGTAGGTFEISVSGANSGGVFNNGGVRENPDFTIYDGEVLFRGLGPGGTPGLWVTNGTTAGTFALSVSGASAGGLDPLDLSAQPSTTTANDFTRDGISDLLLQNGSGNLVDWTLQNGVLAGGNNINNPALYGYSVVHDAFGLASPATGDFNGDGTADILLQNGSGNLVDWIMQNGTLSLGNEIGNPAAYGYSVAATGDFNGDGTSDILLQNSSGNLVDWLVKNGTLSGGNEINNPASYGYSLVGTGDFNGDGTTDLLLQNSSGNLVDWMIQDGTLAGGNEINNPALYGYSLVGTGDFNGNGTTDLLLQNSSGNLVDWMIQNGTLADGNEIGNPALDGYSVVGIGDFTGNGTDDILLQNSSGNLIDWTMQNGKLAGGNVINNPASYGYHLA